MTGRFPDLGEIANSAPVYDGFLEGLMFLGVLSALVYLIPLLAVCLFFTGLPYAARLTGLLGISVCLGGPAVWAVIVPGGLWYLLLPMLAPALIMSFLMYRGGTARLIAEARKSATVPDDS